MSESETATIPAEEMCLLTEDDQIRLRAKEWRRDCKEHGENISLKDAEKLVRAEMGLED